MADVTRDEFDALVTRVRALEGKTTTPPLTSYYTVTAPTVKVDGTSYSITGALTANRAKKFTYLQLAVRGTGATDLALSPDTTLNAGQTKTLTGRGDYASGDYTAWVAWSLDGKTWVDGPKTKFSAKGSPVSSQPIRQPAGTAPGKVGRSGLPFNSLVFRQSADDMHAFGDRRGVGMDGLLYFTGRQNWDDFRWHPSGQVEMLDAGQIVVTSMPHAPENEGDAMNARGANDAYRDQQRDLGRWLADNGFNKPTHYVRVDWECNGDWYAWSANRDGGAEALKQSIANYVTNMRAGGLTKAKFGMCFNKGPNQSGAAFEIFPGPEYIDNLGIDQYDMWAPSYNRSDWEREMAKGPSARIVARFAAEKGITWSWDEGGNTHGDQNQGGDNPIYWQFVYDEIMAHLDNFAYHNTYDDPGAPDTLMHDFARNPKSWAKYQQLWRPA